MSTPTKGTVGLGLVYARAEEGKHYHETVDEPEHDPRHPSGGMQLVEQQAERLHGNNLCNH